MRKLSALLTGAALGATVMYFYDPKLGIRRRKLCMDQFNRLGNELSNSMSTACCDLQNRTCGMVARTKSMFQSGDASDRVIHDRVRSTMGHYVSHPHAISVQVNRGHVRMQGPILHEEVHRLGSALKWVAGVKSITSNFDVHQVAGDTSALQGESRQSKHESCWMRSEWAPSTRLVAGTLGAGLMANCMLRWTPLSMLMGTLGFGLFTRAATNEGPREMLGSPSGTPINIEKTVHIEAPAERVFDFFSDPHNYQRISGQVTKVEDLGSGRFAKEMSLGGVTVRFEEAFTRSEPGVFLQSESLPDSMLHYAKSLWFEEPEDGQTNLHVRFSYHPPGGVFGHAIATVAGVDPKSILDDLLMRAKQFLETGIAPHDAAAGRSRSATSSVGAMAAEQRFSPDVLDQFSDEARNRATPVGFDDIPRDTRDLLGDSEAAQTDEDGQNFVENIATAVTESPTQDEVNEANKPGNTLESDNIGASGTPKPRL